MSFIIQGTRLNNAIFGAVFVNLEYTYLMELNYTPKLVDIKREDRDK